MRIAVLKGGPSAEREVSLRTGAAVARALQGRGHEVEEVDVVDSEFVFATIPDIAFICLHGTFGEDGQVQRELERRGVKYTGCGVEASARAFDKAQAKACFAIAKVPTPRGVSWMSGNEVPLSPPLVVKPACQGSSVGLAFVNSPEELMPALESARQFGEPVIVEERIVGRELTVGILGDRALPIVEVRPKAGSYDYANKYTPGRTEYFCPAPLDAESTTRVQAAARAAHEAIGGSVYSRVDVILDAEGRPWVLEVNTIPGMTETSLLPKAAQAEGIGFGELCEEIIALSLRARKENG